MLLNIKHEQGLITELKYSNFAFIFIFFAKINNVTNESGGVVNPYKIQKIRSDQFHINSFYLSDQVPIVQIRRAERSFRQLVLSLAESC